MALARVTVCVGAEIALRPRPFIADSGERCAWLELGDGSEVGLYGAPAEMRRLGAAVIAAAALAETLPDDGGPAQAAVRAVACS
jgi:hypothetical protein